MLSNFPRGRSLIARWFSALILTSAVLATDLPGQNADERLKTLLSIGDSTNPMISAARSRSLAARARVRPSSAWPDPMLMAGILNLPLGRMTPEPGAGKQLPGDDMTMKMIGVEQTIPYPGKLSLRRKILELEADGADAALSGTRREIARDIKNSFYELAYLNRSGEIVRNSSSTLSAVVQLAESNYATGLSAQQDVLKARVEAARVGEMASGIEEQKQMERAKLDALLDRKGDYGSLTAPAIPARIAEAAVPKDASQIRFVSGTLGARAADSPLPAMETLQELALRNNATLRAADSNIAAETARVALAQKGYKPDFDVSLQYGQRTQRPDMISAVVSIPLPIHRGARQNQEVAEARSELAAAQSDYRAEANRVRAEVTRLVGEVERNRTQLALYTKAILPQGAAAVSSSLATYRTGKGDLLSVLNNQSTLQTYQIGELRAMTDFAKAIAELEAILGVEVLQ
ncbi:MAG: TolC family protein [Gemmatimonadaceae bacterium]|nr:TolC family protein [Gemmatimonadaceae bacterium]